MIQHNWLYTLWIWYIVVVFCLILLSNLIIIIMQNAHRCWTRVVNDIEELMEVCIFSRVWLRYSLFPREVFWQYMRFICSSDPSRFPWSRGIICTLSYHHYQFRIINLAHCCHVFHNYLLKVTVRSSFFGYFIFDFLSREIWGFVFLPWCLWCTNNRMYDSDIVFACLHITHHNYHYHNHT